MEMPFLSTIDAPHRRDMLASVAKVLIDRKEEAVEMQEVLEQSGMLYEAIAKEFKDLDDPLLSLVRCVSRWVSDPLAAKAERPTSHGDMVERMIEFGRRYAHANTTILPGIFRVFLTESSRRSQLKKKFYDVGPLAISKSLIAFLDRARSAKLIDAPASEFVAEALMGMLREPLYNNLAIHSKSLTSALSSADKVPDLIRLFVKGCTRRSER